MNGNVYEFIVINKLHPHSQQIYDCLVHLIREAGIVGCMSDDPASGDNFILGAEFGSWVYFVNENSLSISLRSFSL